MIKFKSLVHKFGRWYIEEMCKRECENQEFRWVNERPIEYRFVFQCLSRISPITVLDVGTGTTALPHLFRNFGFLVTALTIYMNIGQMVCSTDISM